MTFRKKAWLGATALLAVALTAQIAYAALQVPSKGLRLTDWYALATAHNGMNNYSTQSLVATGSAQASAAQITSPLVFVPTSSASTGIALPACSGTSSGAVVHVTNQSGQTITVYGKSGSSDTINTTAGSTGVTMSTSTAALFVCSINAKWGKL